MLRARPRDGCDRSHSRRVSRHISDSYLKCSSAWQFYTGGSLSDLITKEKG